MVSRDANDMKQYEEDLKDAKQNEKVDIVYENENGYVAKINR